MANPKQGTQELISNHPVMIIELLESGDHF
jgi:hypothetical protein